MPEIGFKKLTSSNWLEPDDTSLKLLSTTASGNVHPDPGDRWINFVLEPTLSDDVPIEVCRLFEVARSVIAYGFLFYPLFAMGLEQLARVSEAAVIHRCIIEGAPKSKLKFDRAIEWLYRKSILNSDQRKTWHSMRTARNVASHPKSQMILPPGVVLGAVEKFASRINVLFSDA
ncbi:MAG: hypothetical protein IIA89_02770 [Chloroflexi bacterium]|nr:hypothetical protein [Chloroflexota bacterium]